MKSLLQLFHKQVHSLVEELVSIQPQLLAQLQLAIIIMETLTSSIEFKNHFPSKMPRKQAITIS